MTDDETIKEAKSLLIDRTCENCKYGRWSYDNHYQSDECYISGSAAKMPKEHYCERWE